MFVGSFRVGEVVVCVDQDIKEWELIIRIEFISKIKYEIVLEDCVVHLYYWRGGYHRRNVNNFFHIIGNFIF